MSRPGKVEAYEYIADADLAANGGLVEGPKTKINIENLVSGAVPDASETVKGKAELATVAEAIAGTDPERIVTPAGLAAAIAALAGSLFIDNYVFIGAIATTTAPAITVTELVNSFPALTITPANTGTGTWTLTADVAGTYAATSLVLCQAIYGSSGTVKAAADVTSDTVVTLTTRGVPGSAANINANNIPFIVITPKP